MKLVGVAVRLFLAVFVVLLAAPPDAWAHHPVRGDPVAGRLVAKACIACHGGDGLGPVAGFPSLHGQQESYLIKQLVEMRHAAKERAGDAKPRPADVEKLLHSARSNEIMDEVVYDLTDDDIKNVSAFYSQRKCPAGPGPVPTPPPVEIRCQVCHGKTGVAETRHLPNIAGQDYDYLLKQLMQFKAASEGDGDQRSRTVMESQVRTLSEQDIRDLARFYSSLTCTH